MSFAEFMAAQLRQPAGFFGRNVMVRLLNRLNVPINKLALDVLRLGANDRVLEIGFGGGDLIARMSRVVSLGHVSGVDFSSDAVEACTRRFRALIRAGRVDLHCADVGELPFADGTFTKACTVNTIYFWPDPLAAFRQIHRVLRECGTLVVCFNPRSTVEKNKVMQHRFTLYEAEEVTALLAAAGFRDVRFVFGRHRFGRCVAAEGTK